MPIGNVQAPAVSSIAAAGVQGVSPVRRSPWVAPVLELIANDAKRGVAARTFAFADNAKVDSWLFAYHTGKAKEMNLLSAPPNGKLQLTMANHVSGHSNEADKFARTNEAWTIQVSGPTGSQTLRTSTGGSPTNPVYAFAKDIEIDVSKPGNYVITAAPDLSAGVGGYVEGRKYNLHVGKENFFKPTDPPPNFRAEPNTTYPYPIREADDLAWQIRSQGLG